MAERKKTVVVGMSGGVDSSVAALLLKADYNVIGVSLQVFDYSEFQECELQGVCCSPEDVYDARQIASKLSIPFYVLNYREKFRKTIIDNFISEYLSGKTPNPCVICNEMIKFGEMLCFALSVGADFVATGHYVITEDLGSERVLKMGIDRQKDQSYFLYRLSQQQLKRSIFPVGRLTKDKVREIARQNGLDVHSKRESHEICFIPDNNYPEFISKNIREDLSGKIVRTDGRILGRHRGFFRYTIGQRRGLNISSDKPLYVTGIDPYKKEVIVGYENELYADTFIIRQNNFIYQSCQIDKMAGLKVKVRYHSEPQECSARYSDDGSVIVKTSKAIRAITPGQSAVIYQEDIVVGGGIISEVIH
ncbi:MAG: tRNA 2-thiouridine(34) synthase MnmA [Deltaproteobacteria bacterium]|nr:tRNA 2-thiouridine(34) synthase MnmA [Deltaproteobacteria bacterium]